MKLQRLNVLYTSYLNEEEMLQKEEGKKLEKKYATQKI